MGGGQAHPSPKYAPVLSLWTLLRRAVCRLNHSLKSLLHVSHSRAPVELPYHLAVLSPAELTQCSLRVAGFHGTIDDARAAGSRAPLTWQRAIPHFNDGLGLLVSARAWTLLTAGQNNAYISTYGGQQTLKYAITVAPTPRRGAAGAGGRGGARINVFPVGCVLYSYALKICNKDHSNLAKDGIARMQMKSVTFETPHFFLGGGEIVGGQRWYHSKERWWSLAYIGSPLWALLYL